MRLLAHAKVNYALEISGVRPDGYHELRTVMQSISLADEVRVESGESAGSGLELTFEPTGPALGPVERNTVYRAWELLQERLGRGLSVRVTVEKNIPSGAGLGGGSADAAAALVGMNEVCGLGLTPEELRTIGFGIGVDVPFCLSGGTALGEGVGELLSPLPAPPGHYVLVSKPVAGASTPEIYRAYDELERDLGRASVGAVLEALRSGNLELLAAGLQNDLTAATVARVSEVGDLRSALLREGALGVEMSGSGTAVYGIFDSRAAAGRAADRVTASFVGVYEPVGGGVVLL